MDYYPNVVIDATPFIERQAPAGTNPFDLLATPFIVTEGRGDYGLIQGFLAQGVSSGQESRICQPGMTGVTGEIPGQEDVPSDADALTQLARRRVALIQARNASSSSSLELRERLRILNERMNQQSPRVTEAHIRSLEEAVTLGEEVARRRAARMALLQR